MGDAWHDPANPVAVVFKGQRLDLWSLKPVANPEPPAVKRADWVRQPLDAFVLAKLEAAGLEPAPMAESRVLVRRLFLDLTGLPPTAEEMREFLADEKPDAVERLVDRLLSTRAYGEHWARQWLDVVRYSDSNGYDWDEFRPQAWRFRDYVIRSFAADKPFDRFLREQLAGDEMVDGAPKSAAEQDCLIATGYLRVGPYDNSSKLFGEEEKARASHLADLTETTASIFLAQTMTCCRCHDHKTDPLLQADHYRLRACFAGVEFRDSQPLDLAEEQEGIRAANAPLEEELKRLQAAKKKGADEDVKSIKSRLRTFTTGLIAGEGAKPPPATHILALGDPAAPQKEVEAGFLSVFNPAPATLKSPPSGSSGRRAALADWLTSRENPLTARVMVNRIWQGCFGQGLVATPNDFGWSGARPSHPELLDFLATRFVEQGWSVKKMIRQLVLSAAYQQAAIVPDEAGRARAAGVDASNSLLWRANLRRLTAEQLRDAVLLVSGRLTPREGGPPVWPPLPPEVLQANPAFLDDNPEKTKGWYPSPPEALTVRSIYLVQKRSVHLPFMETFDQPDNFTSCPRRSASTVAPQALTLLNNAFTTVAAQALAARVTVTGPEAVREIWQLALLRPPTVEEEALCVKLVAEGGLVGVCRVVLNLNEFITIE